MHYHPEIEEPAVYLTLRAVFGFLLAGHRAVWWMGIKMKVTTELVNYKWF